MKKKKWVVPVVVLALLAVVVGVVFALLHMGKAPDNTQNNAPEKNEVVAKEITFTGGHDDIQIGDFNSIAGFFVEDMSDEVVDGVMAVEFTNKSEKTLEYARIILTIDKEEYVFEISTVPGGETVRAMEQNKKDLPDKIKKCDVNVQKARWFKEEPSMHKEKIKIKKRSSGLVLVNKSEKSIKAPIYVYYKTKVDGVYVGGITYRVTLNQKLKKGKSVAVAANHFDPETSEIMFVEYGK